MKNNSLGIIGIVLIVIGSFAITQFALAGNQPFLVILIPILLIVVGVWLWAMYHK